MPAVDFYCAPASPPCRAVQMVADAIGVKLNKKEVDLAAGEHMKPEFLKMNPQHTVPVVNDNGFCLWESRAIIGYLVDQYAKDDSLYPKDGQKRALVNQRLFFDLHTLYESFADYYFPVMFDGAKAYDSEKLKKLKESFGYLNTFLDGKEWVTGSAMTIADYSIVASVSSADALGFDIKKYPNVQAWLSRTKKAINLYEEHYHPDAMMLRKWYDEASVKE